jgi:protein N-terminal methyltransferase
VDNESLDGVLGGFGHLDTDDILESRQFLKSLKVTNFERSVDCGGGIGRVAKHLLIPLFKKVDLVEPTKNLIDAARVFVDSDKLDKLYMVGLESFVFEHKYDVIWVQWCIGHLTDGIFIDLLTISR